MEALELRVVPTLNFTTQPGDIAIGQILAPITVLVSGTSAVDVTISLSEQSSNGAPILGGTVTATSSGGGTNTVTFNNLYIYGGTAQNATLTALSFPTAVFTPDFAVSNQFQVKPGGVNLFFPDTIPTTVAGASLGIQPLTVQELDANGMIAFGDNTTQVQLYIQSSGGNISQVASPTVTNTIVTVQNPLALAFGMSVSGPGIPANTTITAIDTKTNQITLSNPATIAAGATLNFTPNFLDAVTKLVVAAPTATMVNGIATFTGPNGHPLTIDKAGLGYTLGVVATNNSTLTPTPAVSNAFVVTAGVPTGLAFLVQPTFTDSNVITVATNVTASFIINEYNPNTSFSNTWTGVVVGVVDQFGNQVTNGLGGSLTVTTSGLFSTVQRAGESKADSLVLTFNDATATSGLQPGMAVTGKGIKPGTVIAQILGGTSVQLSQKAGSDAGKDTFTIGATTTVPINASTGVATFTNLQWGFGGQQATTAVANAGDVLLKIQDINDKRLQLGMTVTGPGIKPGTTITSINITGVDKDKIGLSQGVDTGGVPNSSTIFFNFAGSQTLTAQASIAGVTFNGTKVPVVAAATSNPFTVSVAKRASLEFVPGFTLPSSFSVGSTLPVIKIQVLDANNKILTSDNTDQITISGPFNGTVTQTVVNGIATFDDLAILNLGLNKITTIDAASDGKPIASTSSITVANTAGFTIPNGGTIPFAFITVGTTNGPQTIKYTGISGKDFTGCTTTGTGNLITGASVTQPNGPTTVNFELPGVAGLIKTTTIQTTAGTAYNLAYGNVNVGAATAGTYLRDSIGQPIQINVVDQNNNIVTTDNSTIVSIGLLPNQGRGPVFVGNGTVAGANTFVPAGNPNSYDFRATAQVVNGVATFPNLYINFAGTGYILSASTTSFATHSGADTKQFTVSAASAVQLVFGNQVNTSNANTRFNFIGTPIPGVTGVAVEALDAFGNVATSFNGQVTIGLQNPGSGPGVLTSNTGATGAITLTADQGFAYLNSVYIGNDDPSPSTKPGGTTLGSKIVTLPDTTGLSTNMFVLGDGIPALTTITAVGPGNQITISNVATATATAVTLTFNGDSYNLTAASRTTTATTGQSLPTATINVASVAGFPTSGTLLITTSAGIQTVTYTGINTSTNTFTGCVGGSGSTTGFGAVTFVTATTVAGPSIGLSLPQATINVASTAGFPTFGTIFVETSAGTQTVTYTGVTGTSFTGCSGGTGTLLATANTVQFFMSSTSNKFPLMKPAFTSGTPTVKIDNITGAVTSGTPFTITVHLQDNGVDTNKFNGAANVVLELRDTNGKLILNGPTVTFAYNSGATPDKVTGIITYQGTITATTKGNYTILALLDLNAQTSQTASFDPPANQAPLGSAGNSVIQYGLGSLTTSFDTITAFPVYQALPIGGRSYPPVVGFDPASSTIPLLQQPNVADGFNQVPQSTKWWSSLMFPRTKPAATDYLTPQDSQHDQLFALTAQPLTAMVNSNGSFPLMASFLKDTNPDTITLNQMPDTSTPVLIPGATVSGVGIQANTHILTITQIPDPKHAGQKTLQLTLDKPVTQDSGGSGTQLLFNTNFAGLGLSYLTDLFLLPSKAFNDPPVPFVPANQPQAWANPQAPGAETWLYNWFGNGNNRQYQDFAVGLQGVQADGKILRYSESTVTLDWKGIDAASKNQELQATLGEGLPFVYFTVPTATDSQKTAIQLVTSPKNIFSTATNTQGVTKVTVTAYDKNGAVISAGNGPFEMEISYQFHDVLDELNQVGSTTNTSTTLTVADTTPLLLNMSVVGAGIPDNTIITGIVDATHVTINNAATSTATGVRFTFNSVSGPTFTRTFDHFYGVYLPKDTPWQLSGADEQTGNRTLTANLDSKNFFSIATLPASNQTQASTAFNLFLSHAYTFVTGTTSSFNFVPATGIVTTTYSLQTQIMQTMPGDTAPLQTLNASQYNNLTASELLLLKAFNPQTSSGTATYSYVSPHGELLLWDGATFQTQLHYKGGVLPSVPPLQSGLTGVGGDADLWFNQLIPVLRSASSVPLKNGAYSLDLLFPNDNNYLQAQAMYGAAQLVPLLLEVANSTDPGLTASNKAQAAAYAEAVYNAVKNQMGAWLSASDDRAQQLLYYQPATPQDTTLKATNPGAPGWQALLSIQSGFLSSETLNDQQLITGYFIKVAAFLAQYDGTWGTSTTAVNLGTQDLMGTMGDVVNLMIANVANYDGSNTTSPLLRNFDVWSSHTWADGAANNNVGTNLESSSEAMDFDSAIILWGQATGNTAMRDLGVYLYTSELEGVNTYWLSQTNKTDPYGQPTQAIPTAYLGIPVAPPQAGSVSGATLTLTQPNPQITVGMRVTGPGIPTGDTVATISPNGLIITLTVAGTTGSGSYDFGGTKAAVSATTTVGTTVGSRALTLDAPNSNIVAGQAVTGPGIGPDTIVATNSGTTITLNNPAVAGAGAGTFTFGGSQRTVVSKLNTAGGSFVGFIGFQTTRVTGIQLLPFSGSAYYLGSDPSFVNTTYGLAQVGATAQGTIPFGPPTYQSLLIPYEALSNPSAALAQYLNAIGANFTLTGTSTNGSTTLTLTSTSAQLKVGQAVAGPGIREGTTVTAINTNVDTSSGQAVITVTATLSQAALPGAGTGTFIFGSGGVINVSPTSTSTNGSASLTLTGTPAQLYQIKVGQGVSGPGIPIGDTVAGITTDISGQVTGVTLATAAGPGAGAGTFSFFGATVNSISPVNPLDFIDNNASNVHWMETLNNYGTVDNTVTADTVSYVVFKKGLLHTYVVYNPGAVAETVNFSTGKTFTVAPHTTAVFNDAGTSIGALADPNYAMPTPQNRFFLTADAANKTKLSYGETGTNATNLKIDTQPITFTMTGVSGSLKGQTALPQFQFWFDPDRATGTAPDVQVKITYNQKGLTDAQHTLTQTFSVFSMGALPGYVVDDSHLGSDGNSVQYFTSLDNATITITITPLGGVSAATPVFLRVNAAEQQGKVSFVDLPYNFTEIGGNPVSQVNLGGPTFGQGLPNIAGAPPAPAVTPIAPSPSHNGWATAYNATTKTVTLDAAGLVAGQTLQITVDANGNLVNNRFAAGDQAFTSASDFGQGSAGNLPGSGTTIIIKNANGDQVILGSNNAPASTLQSTIQVQTAASNGGALVINDSFRVAEGNYTVNSVTGGVSITTTAAVGTGTGLNVSLLGANVFSGGVTLNAGRNAAISVLKTRDGEQLNVNGNGSSVVNVGGGIMPNLLGNVNIGNSAPGSFTDLVVNNIAGTNFSSNVTVSASSITGMSKGNILYSNGSIGNLFIIGGGNVTYSLAGTPGGSSVALDTGGGQNTVVLSKDSLVNSTSFSGALLLSGHAGSKLIINDSKNTSSENVTVINGTITGFTNRPIQTQGFGTLELKLGTAANSLSVDTQTVTQSLVATSGGALSLTKALIKGNLTVTGAATVTVGGAAATAISTNGGTVSITGVGSITVTKTIDTTPGVGGTVSITGTVTPSSPTDPLYNKGAGNITLNAGAATQTITVSGGNGQSTAVGTAFATQLQVTVMNGANPAIGIDVTFTAPSSGASGTFANGQTTFTTKTVAGGVATATFTANTTPGASYTVSATTAQTISNPANFTLSNTTSATQLVFIGGPVNGVAAAALTSAGGNPVTVQLEDQFGNHIATQNVQVDITLGTNPGNGALQGTTVSALTDATGLATFNGTLIITASTTSGIGYTLAASATSPSVSGTSLPFNQASQLLFDQQPTTTVANQTIRTVTVIAADQAGNTVSGINIGMAILNNPSGGTLSGTTTVATDGFGFASFGDLSINNTGTGYTLQASSAAINTTSTAFNIVAVPNSISFTQQPTTGLAGANLNPSVTVTVLDASGRADPNIPVTITIGTNPGGATLSGNTTVFTNQNGVATFDNLSLSAAGSGYTLVATVTGVAPLTSNPFNQAGTPTTIATNGGTGTQNVTVNTAFSALKALVTDSNGVGVPGVSVTFTAPDSGPSGTFAGNTLTITVKTDSSGIATAPFTANKTAGGPFIVKAKTGSLTTDFSLTNNADVAASIGVFDGSPQNAQISTDYSPLEAIVKDQFGNPVSGASVTFTQPAQAGASGTFATSGAGADTVTSGTNGVAIASTFTANANQGSYTVSAVTGVLPQANFSLNNTASTPAATKVAFIVGPSNGTAGAVVSPAITVQVQDAGGFAVAGTFTVELDFGQNPGNATLAGNSVTTDGTGLATFNNLTISAPGIGYTLVAKSQGLASSLPSSAFTMQASTIQFVTQPTSGNINTAIPVVVKATDSNGNALANVPVTMKIGNNPGGATLGGTTTVVTGVDGKATFTDLTINQQGPNYTLIASTPSAGSTTITSQSFSQAGTATKMVMVQQPTDTIVGAIITPAVTVQVQDSSGDPVFGSFSILMGFAVNPATATLGGTLTRQTNSSGLATFDDLTVNQVSDGYSLKSFFFGLASAISNDFNVTPAAATQVKILSEPPASVSAGQPFGLTVAVEDQFGNIVSSDNKSTVTLTLSSGSFGPGSTTSLVVSNGVANFSNLLSIDLVGSYTITANDGSLTPDTSANVQVTPGLASYVVITTQPPADVTKGTAFGLVATIEDAFGNVITTDNSSSVSLTLSSGSFAAGSTTSVPAVAGVATFTNLIINTPNIYNITASSGLLTQATSDDFTVGPVSAPVFTTASSTTFPIFSLKGTFTSPTTVTVPSTSQLIDGMQVRGPGIAPNTFITVVNATTVNLTTPANPGTGSGIFVFGGASFTVVASGATSFTTSGTLPVGVTLTDNGDGTATLAGAPTFDTGNFVFQIIATNANFDLSATQLFALTVTAPPRVTTTVSNVATSSTTYSVGAVNPPIRVTAAAPAGTTLPSTVTVTGLPKGLIFTPVTNGGTISGTLAAGAGGVYPLTITAKNATGSTVQIFTLTVNQPKPAFVTVGSTTFTRGQSGSYVIRATGFSTTLPTLTTTATMPANVTFTSVPNVSTTGTSTLGSNTLTVADVTGIVVGMGVTGPGIANGATVTAVGVTTVTLSSKANILAGAGTFNFGGIATITSTSSTAALVKTFSITATIGTKTTAQAFTLTVKQPALAITSVARTAFQQGQAATFTVTTTGFPVPTLTFAGTLPAGVTFLDNGNGTATISGTPTAAGSNSTITISAKIGTAPAVKQTFTLAVVNYTTPSGTVATFTAGKAGTATIPGSFPAGTTFTVTNGKLPAGITLTRSAVARTGTSASGSSTLTVASGAGLLVGMGVTGRGITAGTTVTAVSGTTVTLSAAAGTGAGAGTFTFTRITVAGTPAATSGGSYSFQILSNKSQSALSPVYTIIVNQPRPTIVAPATAALTVGKASTINVTTTGFPVAAIDLASGSLPDGVTLVDNGNGTATLSGTPEPGSAGTYILRITAKNPSSNLITFKTLTLTVNETPLITSPNTATFQFNTGNGFLITATGVPTPTLTVTGTLPQGVTFAQIASGLGQLSGIPKQKGTFTFLITATSGTQKALQLFTLTVA